MTAASIFQQNTGSGAFLTSGATSSLPLGLCPAGQIFTPDEFLPELTAGILDLGIEAWEIPTESEELFAQPGFVDEIDDSAPAPLSGHEDPTLQELWDNSDDAGYDDPSTR